MTSGDPNPRRLERASKVIDSPCGLDDPRIRTFGLLIEAYARLTRDLDTDLQRTDGISLQTFEVLLRIARAPESRLTMTELAGAMALTTGGVTRLADRLEKDGLVMRGACPGDRRVVHLTITDQGRTVFEGALVNHLDSLDLRVSSRLGEQEAAILDRAMDLLRQPLT